MQQYQAGIGGNVSVQYTWEDNPPSMGLVLLSGRLVDILGETFASSSHCLSFAGNSRAATFFFANIHMVSNWRGS